MKALRELIVTAEHARKFIDKRMKMHPDGVAFYDEAVARAREALSTPPSEPEGWRDLLEQCKRDFAAAHAEICKLQNIDPAKHTWPQWSSVAHTLAWIDRVLAAAPAPTEGERG